MARSQVKLKLFADMISQPARAVTLFCRRAHIPVTIENVIIGRGQTRSAEFLKLNPRGLVPVIEERSDDGSEPFVLNESAAILRYLANSRSNVAAHFYPAEARHRARVDAFLDFYHTELRPTAKDWVYSSVLGPNLGKPRDEAHIERSMAGLGRNMGLLASELTSKSSLRAVGDVDKPTIADFLLACELTQLDLLPIASRPPPGPRGAERPSEAAEWARMLREQPAVADWLKAFALSCGPVWGEVHTMLYKLQARLHGSATGPAVKLQ